jgi:hypothetical protein
LPHKPQEFTSLLKSVSQSGDVALQFPKPCTQLTAWQAPVAHCASVLAGPVVHTSPSAFAACTHRPVVGAHVPGCLHSVSGQVMGDWPVHAPEIQTSVVVQRSASSQAVLSAFAAATHESVTVLQLGTWHDVTVTRPVQSFVVGPLQVPSAWQTSPVVQNFPSLHAPPTARGKQPSQQVLMPEQPQLCVDDDGADSALKPTAFCAATVKVYGVPVVRPEKLAVVAPVVVTSTAPGLRVTR